MTSTGSGFVNLRGLWLNIDHIIAVRRVTEMDAAPPLAVTMLEATGGRTYALDIPISDLMDLITRTAGWNEHDVREASADDAEVGR